LKITAKIKLLPTPEQHKALLATLQRCNECANWLSTEAWKLKTFNYFQLQKPLYHPARKQFELNSQLTVRVFSKVADAYKLDKKRERRFGKTGAIAFDDRILSWRKDSVINIWLLGGRQSMNYVAGPRQQEQLKQRQGESDLLYHRGKWFLAVTCNVEEPTLAEVDEWLGIDMGVANIATDSDGGNYSGSGLKSVRHRHRRLRTKLQSKGTRGARRKLRELSGREYRFASDTNHVISKQIVAKAKDTSRGIVVENLTHIRRRITARRKQRAVLHSWAFAQLREFLVYKATLAGVPIIVVDPRNSSRECSKCGHIDKRNRLSQSKFRCLVCGHEENADLNASRVLAGRASASEPNASQSTADAS
jgi:putative transposase